MLFSRFPFFFPDPASTVIYTLSLHDALPISVRWGVLYLYACLAGLSHILLDFTNNYGVRPFWPFSERWYSWDIVFIVERSEEHTSELQSQFHLVCRLLLEKKNNCRARRGRRA